MAIRRTHGKVSSIAKLGALAGKSVEARRQQQRRDTKLARAQEMQQREMLAEQERQARLEINVADINARKESQVMAMGWENQKMLMESQFKFEMAQMQDRAWEQRELAKSIKKADEYDLAKDKVDIMKAEGTVDDETYNKYMARIEFQYLGYENIMSREKPMTAMEQMMQQVMGSGNTGTPTPTGPPQGQMEVIAPDGKTGFIPIEQWEEASTKGYKMKPHAVTTPKKDPLGSGYPYRGMKALGGSWGNWQGQ